MATEPQVHIHEGHSEPQVHTQEGHSEPQVHTQEGQSAPSNILAEPSRQENDGEEGEPASGPSAPKHKVTTILSLPRCSIWILLLVLAPIAIGSGLGGALVVCRNAGHVFKLRKRPRAHTHVVNRSKCDPSNSSNNNDNSHSNTATAAAPTPTTPTSSSFYIPPSLSQISSLNISCPNTPLDSLLGSPAFHGVDTFDCHPDFDLYGQDITGFSVYSLQQCIDACSQYNRFASNRTCQAVVISGNVTLDYWSEIQVNCWLKRTAIGAKGWNGRTLAVMMEKV